MPKISKRQNRDIAHILKMLQSEKRYLEKMLEIQYEGQVKAEQIKFIIRLLITQLRDYEECNNRECSTVLSLLEDKMSEVLKMFEDGELLIRKAKEKIVE